MARAAAALNEPLLESLADRPDAPVREELIEFTPLWEGERFENGRPKVSDDILERMQRVTLTQAWGVLRDSGRILLEVAPPGLTVDDIAADLISRTAGSDLDPGEGVGGGLRRRGSSDPSAQARAVMWPPFVRHSWGPMSPSSSRNSPTA